MLGGCIYLSADADADAGRCRCRCRLQSRFRSQSGRTERDRHVFARGGVADSGRSALALQPGKPSLFPSLDVESAVRSVGVKSGSDPFPPLIAPGPPESGEAGRAREGSSGSTPRASRRRGGRCRRHVLRRSWLAPGDRRASRRGRTERLVVFHDAASRAPLLPKRKAIGSSGVRAVPLASSGEGGWARLQLSPRTRWPRNPTLARTSARTDPTPRVRGRQAGDRPRRRADRGSRETRRRARRRRARPVPRAVPSRRRRA